MWTPITHPPCAQVDATTGQPFQDASCVFQDLWLTKLFPYRNWELTADILEPHWQWVFGVVLSSALILMMGQNVIMKDRNPWPIRFYVTCWNIVWMVISTWGILRLAPVVVHNLHHYTIRDNVCQPAASLWKSGTTGRWVRVWMWLKMTEVLCESFLVVVLKQPCSVLQWFNNYAYVLLHGWHLYTAPVPGGILVILVYFGIVAMMNGYCCYLNVHALPQPTKPTLLLDGIHLTQTLSGVLVSITTLQYWKQSMWDGIPCHANEPHIRIFAFSWSAGHMTIGAYTLLKKWIANRKLKQTTVRAATAKSGKIRKSSKPSSKNKQKVSFEQQEALQTSGAELEKQTDQQQQKSQVEQEQLLKQKVVQLKGAQLKKIKQEKKKAIQAREMEKVVEHEDEEDQDETPILKAEQVVPVEVATISASSDDDDDGAGGGDKKKKKRKRNKKKNKAKSATADHEKQD
jgi:hypothetical protein